LPPGIFAVLDDVCATMHAAKQGADKVTLLLKLRWVSVAWPARLAS
jgi:hypothetical protein